MVCNLDFLLFTKILFPLPAVPLFHTPPYLGHELMVFQSPSWEGKETGGGLRDETLQHEVGTETLKEINDEVYVFVGSEEVEMLRMGKILLGHTGSFDKL